MNLDQWACESELLMHGSPVRGLTEIVASDGGTLARDAESQIVMSDVTVYATPFTSVAIFVATVWSRDGLSGWHTYVEPDGETWPAFFAAPCILRAALDNEGSAYFLPKRDFRPHDRIPGQYVLREGLTSSRVVREVEVTVWDMDAKIIESAYHPRSRKPIRPRTSMGPGIDEVALRSRKIKDLREWPLPQGFTNWHECFEHLERT